MPELGYMHLLVVVVVVVFKYTLNKVHHLLVGISSFFNLLLQLQPWSYLPTQHGKEL